MEAAQPGKRIRVGSRIENHPDLDSGECAIPLRSEFDGNYRLWCGIPGQKIFLTRKDQLYRLAQAERHCGYQRFNQCLLPAKASTDGHRLDTDLSLWHFKRTGNCRAHIEHPLRAGPDHKVMTGGTWRYSDRLRFHIRLVDRVSAIGTFDHHLSLMQTSLNITHLQRRRLADILRTPLFFDLHSLLRDGSMLTSSCNYSCLATRANQRRIRQYSSLRINNCGQRLVIDLHGGGSILGASFCLAYYNGDRMPAPNHFVHCQWGLRTGERICLGHCQRFCGKNSYDSRHSQSRRCIDIQNACMGIRAEDQTRIQHSWQHLVSRIARTPGYFVRSILSRERRANQNRLRCLHHSENFSCRFSRKNNSSIKAAA